jgi:hypothetical protein
MTEPMHTALKKWAPQLQQKLSTAGYSKELGAHVSTAPRDIICKKVIKRNYKKFKIK